MRAWFVSSVLISGCVGFAPAPADLDAGTAVDDGGGLGGSGGGDVSAAGGGAQGGGSTQAGGSTAGGAAAGGSTAGGRAAGGSAAGTADAGVPWVAPPDGGAWGVPDGGVPNDIPANTWVRLGDCPGDAEGREVPPGRGSTWAYEPTSRRFFRYGGYTPRFSNALDTYDPATGRWARLFAEDEHYPATRPGGGANWGLHYDRARQRLWFSGGFANGTTGSHGLWSLDPATTTFTEFEATLPANVARLTYDSVHDLFVASPPEAISVRDRTWTYDVPTRRWTQRTTVGAPQATWSGHYQGVFHEALAKVVIFAPEPAGLVAFSYDAVAHQWTRVATNQAPSTRQISSIAYDRDLQVILLHGVHPTGSDGDITPLNDTWVFNLANGEWREISTPGPTPMRSNLRSRIETTYRQALAYDSDRRRFVMADPDLGVWAFRYDGSQPPGASAIDHGFVPVIGLAARNPPAPGPGEVRRTFPTPVNPRIAALGANQLVKLTDERLTGGEVGWWYDSDQGVMIKYGGCGNQSSPYWAGYGNSLLIFDPGTARYFSRRVSDVSGGLRPHNGCTRSVVYDPARKVSWFFGGVGSGPYSQHPPNPPPGVFAYDFATDRFSKLGPGSEPTVNCNVAFGPSVGLAVYPDQVTQAGQVVKRTWVFDSTTATWTVSADPTSPGVPYAYQRMTWDSQRQRFLSLGLAGSADAGLRNLTMAYDPATRRWTDLQPANQPPYRSSKFGLVYDSRNDVVILLGGSVSWNTDWWNDLWVYLPNENRWERQQPTVLDGGSSPAFTDNMPAGYDPRSNAVIFTDNNEPWAYRYRP